MTAAGVQLALDRLPDPVLLVQVRAGDVRILYGNVAARQRLRLSGNQPPLEAVIRQPQVLDAVAQAAGGHDVEVAFETIAVQPRFWRAFIRPLEGDEVMLVLRDETDARRTERMRGDFLANASHELRTPLAALAGFIATLQGTARDDAEAWERFLRIMAEQAGRMTRLVDDLLSLSRIELNEHVPPLGEVDLAEVARDVAEATRPLGASRGVLIELAISGQLVVTADRDQLAQVVQNLLANAVKYSPANGVVRVSLEGPVLPETARGPTRTGAVGLSLLTPDTEAEGRYGMLRVVDDGPGMARQHLPRLSERFYRVEGQSTGGTGLGLAIVKHVVNRHRGGLQVESAEGDGTTFTVYLPLVR